MKANTSSGKNLFPKTDIYCILSEEHSNGRDNIEIVKEMIDADIKIIQYREKDKEMGEKFRQCSKIRKMTQDIYAILEGDRVAGVVPRERIATGNMAPIDPVSANIVRRWLDSGVPVGFRLRKDGYVSVFNDNVY